MSLTTFSPALLLLFVWALLWIMMDIHFRDLTKVQRWLVPLVILALAVFNHVLRERMGSEYISHAMWLTMHLPFFLLFLYITKCSVIKMAFMILSAFTFTAPTIVVSSVVMRHFGNSQWMLLVSNLVSYALILLLAQFVFRRGFNYLIKYGDDRLFLQFSVVPFLYYLYVFSALGVDFSSLIDSGGWLVRYFPSLEVFVFYFLLLSVYRNLSEKHEIEAEQAALTQRLASSEERIAMLNESEVQTAVYQHDMRHHLNAIDGFLAAGKPQQAEEYIRKVRSDIERITPKRYCDNELVNLLCSSFAGKAQRMGVLRHRAVRRALQCAGERAARRVRSAGGGPLGDALLRRAAGQAARGDPKPLCRGACHARRPAGLRARGAWLRLPQHPDDRRAARRTVRVPRTGRHLFHAAHAARQGGGENPRLTQEAAADAAASFFRPREAKN